MRRVVHASVIALALTTGVSAASRSNSATIVLAPPSSGTLTATSVWPRVGDSVSFAVTYPKQLDKYGVRIILNCFQDGVMVYGESEPYSSTFTLGANSVWGQTGGSAYCVADLYYWSGGTNPTFNWLATTNFTAAGY